jgi:hypothetical protein
MQGTRKRSLCLGRAPCLEGSRVLPRDTRTARQGEKGWGRSFGIDVYRSVGACPPLGNELQGSVVILQIYLAQVAAASVFSRRLSMGTLRGHDGDAMASFFGIMSREMARPRNPPSPGGEGLRGTRKSSPRQNSHRSKDRKSVTLSNPAGGKRLRKVRRQARRPAERRAFRSSSFFCRPTIRSGEKGRRPVTGPGPTRPARQ